MKVRIKEDINLKDLAESCWEGCKFDTLAFLGKYYGTDKIFDVNENKSKSYYIIDSHFVNTKCFEKVLPKEMTIDEISEALGYEVKIKQPKFKVGDKVIGNEKASDEYCVTTKG